MAFTATSKDGTLHRLDVKVKRPDVTAGAQGHVAQNDRSIDLSIQRSIHTAVFPSTGTSSTYGC
jgi:hypothetical protein